MQERNHGKAQALLAWTVSYVAYATYYVGRKGFSVAKKSVERELGVSRDALALIDTGYLVMYSVGQFASGILGDRIGARRLVGYGLIASAVACALFGASSTMVLLFLAFAANGFFQATGWPGTVRTMAEWTTPENRRPVMAVWCTCYQVGGIAATALAAWSLRFGFRAVFFVPAVILVAAGVLVLALLKPGPAAPDVEDAATRTAENIEALRAARRAAIRSPILWSFGASYFAIKLIRYSLLFWLPYYLADSLGYAEGQAGYTSVAFEVGGTLGVIAIGVFTHRFQNLSRAALSAVTLVGLTLALVLYTRIAPLGVAANALGLALIGFCLFGPDSVISGAAAQDAGGPLAAATAAGLVNGVGSVGAIIQGWLNAWVSHTYGWQAVFTTLIVLAFMGALALIPAVMHERARPLHAA